MICKPTQENLVKAGTFLYDDSVLCDVVIVFSPIHYGTGDYEEPPEVCDDIEKPTYYVWFGSTTQRGLFNAGGGGWPTLDEAIASVESRPGFGKTVVWTLTKNETLFNTAL
jgi:hypothetical protein